MKNFLVAMGFGLCAMGSFGQNLSDRLEKAYKIFAADSQMWHAISSLYVIDASTGEVVFDKNSQIGLAGASTQKIVTAATAFELLGKDYRYQTKFCKTRDGAIWVYSNGDPTFGSWRYPNTTDSAIFSAFFKAYNKSIYGVGFIDNEPLKSIPSGWIFEDIGNYYGAAPKNLNWKENQYDIRFFTTKPGEPTILDTLSIPIFRRKYLINNCKTGPKKSGDNAYVYFVPESNTSVIEGTVPADNKTFTISASDYSPGFSFANTFLRYVIDSGKIDGRTSDTNGIQTPKGDFFKTTVLPVYTHYSPSLDSIIYWFLKKSINLYGEALVKTFAYEKQGFGSTDSGVNIVKKFWKEKGLDEDELNIYDGSGLSPLNRLTTHAQVTILKYAKSRDWFKYYYDAFPEYNGMKMKSGTISDVKGFCGYQQSKDGHEYIFSFLVNNYSGRSSGIVNKMYKVLDELK